MPALMMDVSIRCLCDAQPVPELPHRSWQCEDSHSHLRCVFKSRESAALASGPRSPATASASARMPRLAMSSWWTALAAVAARPAARASSTPGGMTYAARGCANNRGDVAQQQWQPMLVSSHCTAQVFMAACKQGAQRQYGGQRLRMLLVQTLIASLHLLCWGGAVAGPMPTVSSPAPGRQSAV